MTRLPTDLRLQLLAAADSGAPNLKPLVRMHAPWAEASWLLSELVPDEPDIAFGLCDTGHGFPELGYVSLTELSEIRGPEGEPVRVDHSFEPCELLVVYAEAARAAGHTVLAPEALSDARQRMRGR
jgi:hypothetical protein